MTLGLSAGGGSIVDEGTIVRGSTYSKGAVVAVVVGGGGGSISLAVVVEGTIIVVMPRTSSSMSLGSFGYRSSPGEI